MSLESTLARIAEIQTALQPRPVAPAVATSSSPGTAGSEAVTGVDGSSPASFQSILQTAQASPSGGTPPIVAVAEREIGVTEQPPGSNDGPRIAVYRSAVPGGGVGPWCAYFVSWCARQAGVPLGDNGQGFAAVDDLWAWAQRTGRAVVNGPGVQPRPGDLVVFHEHVGIVEAVRPDGTIQTIEGNTSNSVMRRTHAAGDAIGYVHLA